MKNLLNAKSIEERSDLLSEQTSTFQRRKDYQYYTQKTSQNTYTLYIRRSFR